MSWTVLDNVTPVARKQHRCSVCYRTIEPGETYRRQRVITDDGPDVWKSCAHCDRVFDAVWASLGSDSAYFMDEGIDLSEWLREYEIEPLNTMFRRQWAGIDVADIPLDALRPAAAEGLTG